MHRCYLLTLIYLAGFTSVPLQAAKAVDPAEALFLHARGQTIAREQLPREHFWPHELDLSLWNKDGKAIGSQNHPVIAHAAIGDYRWIAALARIEEKEGLFSRELGSPGFYFYMVVAAKMVGLRDARAAGPEAEADARAIANNLRAIWAYEALTAVPTPRTHTWASLSGNIHEGPGDADQYQGLTTAVAGERWKSQSYLKHDDHGAFLSWAIDWQPRHDDSNNLRAQGWWWKNTVAVLADRDTYEEKAPPEPFGLTAGDREKLRAIVHGDSEAVRWAVGILSDYGVWRSYRIRQRRTTLGTETVFFVSTNGNKPNHPATSITNEGFWRTIRPSDYHGGVGANRGMRTWIEDGMIHSTVKEAGKSVEMPELGGNLIYEVDYEGRQVSLKLGPAVK